MKTGIMGDIHGNYVALNSVLNDMNKNNIDSIIILGDLLFWGEEPQKCFEKVESLAPMVWIKGNTDLWLNEIDDKFHPTTKRENEIYHEFLRVRQLVSNETMNKIKNLKESQTININNKNILCVHGSDRDMNEPIGIMVPNQYIYDIFDRLPSDILLCAHTHMPYIASYNGKLIMNVGSVGLPADEPRASYGILNFINDSFEYSIRRVVISQRN
jgi:putative phosphoesterase